MIRRASALVAGMLSLAPAAARAQDPAAGQPARPPGQTQTELVILREVFQYPAFARKNPFVPVLARAEGEVAAADLRLIGVIIANDPARSVAVVGNSVALPAEDGSGLVVSEEGQAWYLRVGDSIGNITLVEIHEGRIVIDVVQFGLTDRMTLLLETGIPGGIR